MADHDPLDERLRQYGERWRRDSEPPPGVEDVRRLIASRAAPAERVAAARQRRGRNYQGVLQIAGAAAAVVLIILGVVLLRPDRSQEHPDTATPPTSPELGVATIGGVVLPDVMRYGLGSVSVHARVMWDSTGPCYGDPALRQVFVHSAGMQGCAALDDILPSWVSAIASDSPVWGQRLDLAGTAVTIDGMAGLRSTTECAPIQAGGLVACTSTLTFPDLGVSFKVLSPNRTLADEILDSARAVPAGYVAVPNVAGMSMPDAVAAMEAVGLVGEPDCSEESCRVDGDPRSVTPRAYRVVPIGTTVSIKARP